jgi:hypothetical protein
LIVTHADLAAWCKAESRGESVMAKKATVDRLARIAARLTPDHRCERYLGARVGPYRILATDGCRAVLVSGPPDTEIEEDRLLPAIHGTVTVSATWLKRALSLMKACSGSRGVVSLYLDSRLSRLWLFTRADDGTDAIVWTDANTSGATTTATLQIGYCADALALVGEEITIVAGETLSANVLFTASHDTRAYILAQIYRRETALDSRIAECLVVPHAFAA